MKKKFSSILVAVLILVLSTNVFATSADTSKIVWLQAGDTFTQGKVETEVTAIAVGGTVELYSGSEPTFLNTSSTPPVQFKFIADDGYVLQRPWEAMLIANIVGGYSSDDMKEIWPGSDSVTDFLDDYYDLKITEIEDPLAEEPSETEIILQVEVIRNSYQPENQIIAHLEPELSVELKVTFYEPKPIFDVEFLVHPDFPQGTVAPSDVQHKELNDIINPVPTPNSGYRFVKWWGEFLEYPDIAFVSDSEVNDSEFNEIRPIVRLEAIEDVVYDSGTGVYTFTVDGLIESAEDEDEREMYPNGDGYVTKIYAEFELIPTPDPEPDPDPTPDPTPNPTLYTLTVNVVGEGSVPGFEGTNSFSSGTNVNLGAVEDNPLYEFVGWSGDLVSTDSNGVVVLTGNKTVTATFALIEEPIPEEVPVVEPVEEEMVQEVTVEEEVVLDVATEAIPEAATELPATGGLPVELVALFGTSLVGLGTVIKKKTK